MIRDERTLAIISNNIAKAGGSVLSYAFYSFPSILCYGDENFHYVSYLSLVDSLPNLVEVLVLPNTSDSIVTNIKGSTSIIYHGDFSDENPYDNNFLDMLEYDSIKGDLIVERSYEEDIIQVYTSHLDEHGILHYNIKIPVSSAPVLELAYFQNHDTRYLVLASVVNQCLLN